MIQNYGCGYTIGRKVQRERKKDDGRAAGAHTPKHAHLPHFTYAIAWVYGSSPPRAGRRRVGEGKNMRNLMGGGGGMIPEVKVRWISPRCET